ncbi:Crp/Fnr family transcriptional regulator [Deinococcus cellulosilyticus]|uniref:Crp/Fnr family transcriptional regulator n=1 Tax=Deinococcus cellulosilyticus (strain DSM 18568 / NBRC 106333 / KACC 11606 / 5516J-15) TaxID=1223518 RepID=A0A511N8I0_DEIC1|nr:cyclic nucleotide-binding domain-containing protein [Deinococcus cellulosilyticus]GEM48796.1 Crp/Fnr family transcriptional regulator [Deinococcus cellulosilyticus NBRC 106333 = KACC 11606]
MSEKARLKRGQVLYRDGEPSKLFYRCETGLLRVVKVTTRGRPITVRHILPGDFFGEEILEAKPYQHSVEALTRSTITSFQIDELSEHLMRQVAVSFSDQLRRAMLHEYHLQIGDLRERVIRYLLELVDTPLGGENEDNDLYLRCTHELIAEGTSSTRESVSKIIMDLKQEGLIETGYRQITLKNLDVMKVMARPPMVQEVQ